MRATEVLMGHHGELRALLRQLTEPPEDVAGRALVDRLMVELTLHEMIEDEIFYPAMADVSTLVPVAHAEHRQLADQLAAVLRTPPGTERFAAEASALRQAVEAHAGKEEQEMFPEVERKVDEALLDEIGDALAARLARLRGSRLVQGRLRLKRALIRRTYTTAR